MTKPNVHPTIIRVMIVWNPTPMHFHPIAAVIPNRARRNLETMGDVRSLRLSFFLKCPLHWQVEYAAQPSLHSAVHLASSYHTKCVHLLVSSLANIVEP